MLEAAEATLNKQAEFFVASPDEALDYFVNAACGSPIEGTELPRDVIKATAESVILLHAEDLGPKETGEFKDRNELIRTVADEKSGIPRKIAELRDVRYGPLVRFNKALKGKKTEASSSSKSRYKRMDSYREDSRKASETFNGLMTATDEGQNIPDISGFKDNDEALRAVADYLQAKSFLDQLHWPAKSTNEYKNSYKYFYGAVVAAVRYGSPSVLAIAINKTRDDSVDRLRFWTGQMGKINETIGGRATKQAIEMDELKNDSPIIDDLQTDYVNPEVVAPTQNPGESNPSLWDLVPEVEKRDYSSEEVRIKNQEQSISQDLAERRVLGGPALRDKPGNVIGFTVPDSDEQPSAEQIARYEVRRREARRKRFAKRR